MCFEERKVRVNKMLERSEEEFKVINQIVLLSFNYLFEKSKIPTGSAPFFPPVSLSACFSEAAQGLFTFFSLFCFIPALQTTTCSFLYHPLVFISLCLQSAFGFHLSVSGFSQCMLVCFFKNHFQIFPLLSGCCAWLSCTSESLLSLCLNYSFSMFWIIWFELLSLLF